MGIEKIEFNSVEYNVKDAFGRAITADEFSSQVAYNVGDLCQYSGVLYKCLNGGSGEWSSNNWSQTRIVDQLDSGGEEEREIVYDENEVAKLRSFIENRDLSYFSADWEEVPDYAFYSMATLQEVSFPSCTTIGYQAFNNCSSLQSANFPNCSTIGRQAFVYCTLLQSISLPNCTTIGAMAFQNCSSLQSISFPNCSTIEVQVFYGCTSLQSISIPNCSTIGNFAFRYCSSLQQISFPNCSIIGNSAFNSCTSLQSIYLLSTSVCTLSSTNAFTNTPISQSSYLGYYGSIYVPSSLVTAYKTATNWATYSSRITSYTG